MAQPVFYLLAGPNGAGKSTLYKAALAEGLIPGSAPFVNADLHEAAALQHIADPVERSKAARAWADGERSRCLAGSSAYSALSVRMQLMARCQLVCAVPPRCFQPPPKVHSEVILIEPGPITSRIRENSVPHFEKWVNWEASPRAEEYRSLLDRLYQPKTAPDRFELPASAVTAKLIHPCESRRPRPRYYVTKPTYLMGFARRLLPTRTLDWLIAKG